MEDGELGQGEQVQQQIQIEKQVQVKVQVHQQKQDESESEGPRDGGERPKQRQVQLQEHFFSGLANRNLHHILAKIVSYLSGRDVRTCLWTCRALRHAVMSDREALDREIVFAFNQLKPDPDRWDDEDKQRVQVKPWQVSKEFRAKVRARLEMVKNKRGKIHDGYEGCLARRANSMWDSEADKVMEGARKGFLKDWEDDMIILDKWVMEGMAALGMGKDPDPDGTGINWYHRILGDELFVAQSHRRPIGCKGKIPLRFKKPGAPPEEEGICDCNDMETYLVRLDSRQDKGKGGKVLCKLSYEDEADKEEDEIVRMAYAGTCCFNFQIQTCRRGNKVFCVHGTDLSDWLHDVVKWCKAKGEETIDQYQNKRRYQRPVFGVMVDLDKNEVLWKRRVAKEGEWFFNKRPFMTDKVCGLLLEEVGEDYEDRGNWKPKRLARFDIETGAELPDPCPEKPLWVTRYLRRAYGSDLVALISYTEGQTCLTDPPTQTSTANFCQLVDVATGCVRRHVYLSYGEYVDPKELELFTGFYKKTLDVPQAALFGNRILVMVNTHSMTRNETKMTIEDGTKLFHLPFTTFAFWDLAAPVTATKKFSMPVAMGADGKCVKKASELPEVIAKMVFLPMFEPLAPSITGNIWFLLSWNEDAGSDEEGKVLCAVHAVKINPSVTAVWDGPAVTIDQN